jgi:hypothetical protein
MQQFLNMAGKTLDPDTSKIVASYAFPETLVSDDVYFLTGEWTRINNVIDYAAANGLLDVIKWARKNGCPWNYATCYNAAKGGHLAVLQWARENECPWNKLTCSMAAEGGHLEVLKWARENGCPWDEWICAIAARRGHLEVLQWAPVE